jgi:cobalt/nickel transport protein
MNKRPVILISLLAGLAVALLLSPFASPWPDGLEKVAEKRGFLDKGEHSVLNTPIADYAIPGVKHEGLATALAGVLGVLVVFGTGWGLQTLLARKK